MSGTWHNVVMSHDFIMNTKPGNDLDDVMATLSY